MTPAQLFSEAVRRGLQLAGRGGNLVVTPSDRLEPEFKELLRTHKTALVEWLSRPPCPGYQAVPPDDLPLANICPSPTPAQRELVISYLLRQTCDRLGPLAAWLVRRESRYFDGPGHDWVCGLLVYAAAVDAACWQLNRTEAQVWVLLEGFAEAADGWPQE